MTWDWRAKTIHKQARSAIRIERKKKQKKKELLSLEVQFSKMSEWPAGRKMKCSIEWYIDPQISKVEEKQRHKWNLDWNSDKSHRYWRTQFTLEKVREKRHKGNLDRNSDQRVTNNTHGTKIKTKVYTLEKVRENVTRETWTETATNGSLTPKPV